MTVRRLTDQEIAELREDMQAASLWAKAQLRQRRGQSSTPAVSEHLEPPRSGDREERDQV